MDDATQQFNTRFIVALSSNLDAAATVLGDYISTLLREQGGTPLGPCFTISVPLTAAMVDTRLYPTTDRRLVAARVLAEVLTKATTFAPVLNPQLAATPENPLNNDAHNECRAIHRVIRAMHDGECPQCHNLYASTDMVREREGAMVADHVCPGCGFTITHEQSEAGLKLFGTFMEKNLEIFERWRREPMHA